MARVDVYPLTDPFPSVRFGDVRRTKDGRYFFPVRDDRDRAPCFQLNRMTLECPVEMAGEDPVLRRRISIEPTNEFTPNAERFARADKETIRMVIAEKETLFPGKTFGDKQIKGRFFKSWRGDSERGGVDCRVSPDLKVFDENKEELSLAKLVDLPWQSAWVDVIVRWNGVWFEQHRFGLAWEIVQVRLRDPAPMPYCFDDDATADSDDEILDFFPA